MCFYSSWFIPSFHESIIPIVTCPLVPCNGRRGKSNELMLWAHAIFVKKARKRFTSLKTDILYSMPAFYPPFYLNGHVMPDRKNHDASF